jgi:hypothetical protein
VIPVAKRMQLVQRGKWIHPDAVAANPAHVSVARHGEAANRSYRMRTCTPCLTFSESPICIAGVLTSLPNFSGVVIAGNVIMMNEKTAVIYDIIRNTNP